MAISSTSITFIDGRLGDIDALIAAVPLDSLYFLLNPSLDGIEQIATILAGYTELDAIHIVSHGSEGSLQLGTTTFDVTGAALLDGNWVLEKHTGGIEATGLRSDAFAGVLAALPAIDLTNVAAGTGGFVIYGQDAGDGSGWSVASAGDINGDGFDDLIIGAPAADSAGNAKPYAGDSYVVFGKAGGFGASVDLATVAAGTGGFVINGQDAEDNSGNSVASAGDINGDGFDDLIIGAPSADAAGNAKNLAGDSYVVFGKASGFGASINLATVAAGTSGLVIYGQDAFDSSGSSVASAGDINGDGFDDLIIGSLDGDAADNAKSLAGDSYVVFGKASGFGASIDLATVAAGSGGFVIHGQDAGDYSGFPVASAGDINGDGFDDLVIGAKYADGASNANANAGDSYVLFGKAGSFGASVDLATIAAGTGGFVIHGEDAGDHSGYSVASAGDINGDGFDDLIIGAKYGDAASNAKTDAGDSYVVFGKASGFGASIDLATVAAGAGGFVIHGQDADDLSGWSVASAGDINGDGYDDLIIGAYQGDAANNAKPDAGDAYVLFGKASGFDASIDLATIAAGTGGFVIHGQDAGDQAGTSVSSAGDINGDGFDDLIISAYGGDAAGNAKIRAGESYVLYGKDFTGTVTHSGTTGADTLNGTAGADIMVAGLGNDSVNGAAGADAINGGGGNDLITGGAGADRIDGGSGRDTARYASSATAVTVNLATDLNSGGEAAGDHLESIENLVGSALDDRFTGDTGANVLDGGLGNDTLTGGVGNDTYVVNVATDIVTELLAAGSDTIQSGLSYNLGDTDGAGSNGANVENLTLTGTAVINGTGNALNNSITGNTANNSLSGGLGNDTLIGAAGNDTLSGGTGVDKLAGGTGNDIYVVDIATDIVTELLNAGSDTIQSSVSRNLNDTDGIGSNGGNVENLTLTGAAAINGIGNALNNRVTGNSVNNLLNGGLGNDTLSGAGGNDTLGGSAGIDRLAGGTGNDAFVFGTALSATTNLDTITDFAHLADKLQLDDDVFLQFHFGTALTAGQLYAAAGATAGHDSDDRLIYNTTTGALYYDADGNGAGAAKEFAVLSTHPILSIADFVVIA